MASNWDDQFDFDDLDSKPKAPKKQKQQKKTKKNEDDFFDLDDQVPVKASKLPVIAKKNNELQIPAIGKQKSIKKSKNSYDDYEDIYEQVEETKSPVNNTKAKKVETSNFYEELDDIQDIKPKQKKKQEVKVIPRIINKKEQDEEYYQQLEEINSPVKKETKIQPSSKQQIPKINQKKQQEEEVYEEQFSDYGQDFQAEVQQKNIKPPSKEEPIAKKSQTSVNLKLKEKVQKQVEPKQQKKQYTINSNKMFINKEQKQSKPSIPIIPKPPLKINQTRQNSASKKKVEPTSVNPISLQKKTIEKSSSRKSMNSNDSRKYLGNSRITKKNSTDFIPNKHSLLVEKQFPDNQQKLKSLTNDKIARTNEQIRDMIRKFNEELNELINKNMILLKDRPVEKQPNIDDKVKVLQQQLHSGATALQVVQNELDRLKGRQGELMEQEYQLIVQKKIEQAKQSLKETTKLITRLKVQVNSQGNKLSRQQIQKKVAQELHQIKIKLIQMKKDQEKNEQKFDKVAKMVQQLQSKNADLQYTIQGQKDQAKQKGIVLGIKQQTRKKFQDLKIKISTTENHKRVIQGLQKSKHQKLIHQNDQLRITVRSIESEIMNINKSIEHAQQESIALIKKAQQNQNISAIMKENLDKILKSIQDSQNINFYEIRSEGNKSQASDRPLKNSMYQNLSKEKPSRNSSSKKDNIFNKVKNFEASPQADEINLMKPNFMKKKDKSQESNIRTEPDNKFVDRNHNEQHEKNKKQEQKKKHEQKQKISPVIVQQQKSKPFLLKKNKINSANDQKSVEAISRQQIQVSSPKIQLPPSIAKQQQQKSSLKPKFMKFGRKDRNAESNKEEISIDKPKQQIKQIIEIPKIETQKPVQPQQPVFMPKRFNLRNKIEKKEENYVPTIQKKVQPKEQKKDFVPNYSFKNQEANTPSNIQGKKLENDIKIEVPEDKPKFNLRLRDRQKKQTAENNDYVPTRLTEVPEEKIVSKNIGGYNPFSQEIFNKQDKNIPINQKPKIEENSYTPTRKINIPEKTAQPINNPYAPKDPIKINQQSINNPYAPKPSISNPYASKEPTVIPSISKQINNPYAPKQPVTNPYAPKEPVNNPYAKVEVSNNPYAPKDDGVKKEREGPVKKIKIQNKAPKQNFNIFEQAEDITDVLKPANEPIVPPPKQQKAFNPQKTDEIDLNAMLGIKKQSKPNDLDDLLGDIQVNKKKQKKRNNDFFNDLEL